MKRQGSRTTTAPEHGRIPIAKTIPTKLRNESFFNITDTRHMVMVTTRAMSTTFGSSPDKSDFFSDAKKVRKGDVQTNNCHHRKTNYFKLIIYPRVSPIVSFNIKKADETTATAVRPCVSAAANDRITPGAHGFHEKGGRLRLLIFHGPDLLHVKHRKQNLP